MKPRNYQCRKCGKINQITTPWGMIFTPHLGWHTWLKCECGARKRIQRRIPQPEMLLRWELKTAYNAIEYLENKVGQEGEEYIRDTVLDIYRMLWEAEIMYIDNGELEKAEAMKDMRCMIKLKYDAKEEE